MKLRYLLGIVLILAILSGCTGGGEKKAPDVATVAPETTAAPATTATPATAAPTEVPATTQVALHGVGTCDKCHDAPPMDKWRSGLMATAFEKNPGHKDLCKNCHNVETFCTKSGCHKELPAIMK